MDEADTIESDKGGQSNASKNLKERTELEKVRDEKRKLAKSTLQQLCEITTQFFLLPFLMYSGFGRLTMMRKIKTNYLILCLGQELILHQLPLSMLFYYN